jgi:hypothetical protein
MLAPTAFGKLRQLGQSRFSRQEVNNMKLPKNLGMLLLGIWLILNGLIALFNFKFDGLPVIMAILAIATGVLLLLGR